MRTDVGCTMVLLDRFSNSKPSVSLEITFVSSYSVCYSHQMALDQKTRLRYDASREGVSSSTVGIYRSFFCYDPYSKPWKVGTVRYPDLN